ncbi:MAG: hypothetical protein NC308_09520 [Clostridium sp.]|nr:hypothetical protein [Bacteroides sp.]MCM1199115.1 hypothetical protein [Clostridium sp.]
MKRIFILATVAALVSLAISCSKIIDWNPVTVYIQVQDGDGNDLLDPATGNGWLEGTGITHGGITADLVYLPETKDVLVRYDGFRLVQYKGGYALAFGELDGSMEYDSTSFLIEWPDGKSDEILYTRKLNSVSVKAKEKWLLNGNASSNPILIIK